MIDFDSGGSNAKKQHVYTAEFKQEVVQLMEPVKKVLLSLHVISEFQIVHCTAGEKALLIMGIKRFQEKAIKQSWKKNCVVSNERTKSCVKNVIF